MKIFRTTPVRLLAMLALACVALAAVPGCADSPMKKPNNAQTAVYEARAELGIQEHLANKYYLRAPDCTKPLTVLPCKDFAIATLMQQGIRYAHDTVKAADATVNDPAFDTSTASAIILSMQHTVSLLTSWKSDPRILQTAPQLAHPSAADIEEAKKAAGSGQKAP